MRILGIDPGYARMGWGVVDMRGNRFKVVAYGAFETPPEMNMTDRLKSIYADLMQCISEFDPDSAAIEDLYFNTNATTAMKVGQARGVAILACANSGVEVAEYTPLQIKQALTGYGRAEKQQIQWMVKQLLNLKEMPRLDDTTDALAACICHGNSSGGRRIPR